MVIGERVIHAGQTQARQLIEKALRIADAGHGVQFFARERGRRQALPRRGHAAEAVAAQIHAKRGLVDSGRSRVDHPGIDPARNRLAQRPRGQQQSVAGAALILDRNFDVACEAVVLQSVVEYQHVAFGMGGEQAQGSGRAIAPYPYRTAAGARQQQRLVADQLHRAGGVNRHRRRGAAAVTAADDARLAAVFFQHRGQP